METAKIGNGTLLRQQHLSSPCFTCSSVLGNHQCDNTSSMCMRLGVRCQTAHHPPPPLEQRTQSDYECCCSRGMAVRRLSHQPSQPAASLALARPSWNQVPRESGFPSSAHSLMFTSHNSWCSNFLACLTFCNDMLFHSMFHRGECARDTVPMWDGVEHRLPAH